MDGENPNDFASGTRRRSGTRAALPVAERRSFLKCRNGL
jgi:hypothetical protein